MFPFTLASKTFYILGGLLMSTIFNAASTPVTGVNGGAISVPDFTAAGVASKTLRAPMLVPFNAFGTASGGNVKVNGGAKYAAFCIPNPLTKLSTNFGSGALTNALSFQMGPNASNVSYDVTFEKSCNAGSGGVVIANNLQLGSGAVLTLSGTRLPQTWNGADYIRAGTLSVPNATTTMRVRGFLMDVFGE